MTTQGAVTNGDCVKFVNRNLIASNGAACAGATSFGNPTASVSLSAVNGVATTAMRSDAAPALAQNITPTWTGTHIFRASSGIPVTASPVSIDTTITNITGSAPAVVAATLPASNDATAFIGYGNNALPVVFDFFKTRAAAATSPTTVGSTDGIFKIFAWGAGGTAYRQAGTFGLTIDGTTSATSMPGRWEWAVSAVGSINPTIKMTLNSGGSLILNSAALTTAATDGFLYIAGGPGPPTGVPTAAAGRYPLYYDSTNDQLYIYATAWKQPKTPAGAAIVNWQ